MKNYIHTVCIALICAAISVVAPSLAHAKNVAVATAMQQCNTNEDCALVSHSCNDSCAYVPISRVNLPTQEALYLSSCGKPMSANPVCNMTPQLGAACVNNRCTIDYAYANHAGAKDYKPGAYPVPEKAVPDKVQGDYRGVNDRKDGFSAYNLPQGSVRQDTVGQITTKVYVPPSAPVQGQNYVPLNAQAPAPVYAPQQQPQAKVPANIPPEAIPVQKSLATPVEVVPAPLTQSQYPAQAVAPQPAPAPAATYTPGYNTDARPPLPMPEGYSNELPYKPTAATAPLEYVPAPPVPMIPSASLPAAGQAPRTPAISAAQPAAIPAVGATGIPQAPPGSIPIPPSDLKPAPTFVPPAGTAVLVSPDDPGALPPPGTTLIMPTDAGKTSLKSNGSFGGIPPKKSTYSGNN